MSDITHVFLIVEYMSEKIDATSLVASGWQRNLNGTWSHSTMPVSVSFKTALQIQEKWSALKRKRMKISKTGT